MMATSTNGLSTLKILLANDDGIHAPGLLAMRKALAKLGEVLVVAPATEQSGVGHSITYLSPLTCKEIFDGEAFRGLGSRRFASRLREVGRFGARRR